MSTETGLQGFQRRHLRALANPLNALVQVGDSGATEAVIRAIDAALRDHELIKVRMHQPEDKHGLAEALAERSGAELCGVVGHTVILFRRNPERPRIRIPER
ncbi:MAG: ribosome assembly RNA-binding protein YhbY [Deltaproteobacteria bacterium]|nr:ribosome assembly RNA-binding protein YhbY [Deltaproteobacteria bacterium]